MSEKKNTEQVEYRPIPGFPNYRVGSDGSIWSRFTKALWLNGKRGFTNNAIGSSWKKRKLTLARGGYYRVNLCVNQVCKTVLIHRIVLIAFIGPRPHKGYQGCHNNGVKTDNRPCNLRWDTCKGNHADKLQHGTLQWGERAGQAKLNIKQVKEILSATEPRIKTARRFGVSRSTIREIQNRNTWRYL